MERKWKSWLVLLLISTIFLAHAIDIEKIENELQFLTPSEKIETLNILSFYFLIKEPYKSLDYALQAYDLSYSLKDDVSMYEALENCATAYGVLNDFSQAKKYYLIAFDLNKKFRNSQNEMSLISNLAFVEYMLNNLESAISYYEKLIQLYNKNNIRDKKSDAFSKMAQIYRELELPELAIEFYLRSLEIDEQKIREMLINKSFLAQFGDDSTAVAYYELLLKSQNLAVRSNESSKSVKSDSEIRDLKVKETELQKMLQQAKQETIDKERTLESTRREKAINDLKLQHKEFEIKNYQLELQQKELDIMRQQTQRNYFLIVLLVFLFLVILNSYLYYMKQKDNRILEKANQDVKQKNEELILLNIKLEEIARTDPLTNLSNRRDMLEKLEYEKVRFSRGNNIFVLIICDIDNFKIVNDTYGHDFGDVVLRRISAIMQETLRKQDVVSRWGGEEFLILLPETNLEGGMIAAEKIRKKIQQEIFEFNGKRVLVTMTFGVEIYHKVEESIATINRADQALYYGKNTGKNKVVAYSDLQK
jgi:diguanylate cyclase (GGDEF)-like protein